MSVVGSPNRKVNLKKVLLTELLTSADPGKRILSLIPYDSTCALKSAGARCALMTAIVETVDEEGSPEDLYRRATGDLRDELPEGLASIRDDVRQILRTVLTSPAGRPKTSALSRAEQFRLSQQRRRARLASKKE